MKLIIEYLERTRSKILFITSIITSIYSYFQINGFITFTNRLNQNKINI
jgi:hypothetical protein